MNAPALIPAKPAVRRNIWATNGGIYFGLQAMPPLDPDRPLAGKDDEPSVTTEPRTSWQASGDELPYTSDRHAVTVGPNGSGKTRKLLLPNLYRLRDWSCVVIDPKGENCAHTAPYLASVPGHQVRVVDPFGVMKEPQYAKLYKKHGDILRSVGLNPMSSLKPKIMRDGQEVANPRFVDAANAIAEALIKTDDSRDPYWPMAAQAVVTGLLLGLALAVGEGASLGMLRDTLGLAPEEFAKRCSNLVRDYGAQCPALAPNLNRFADYKADNKELGAIIGTALAQTRWLDSPEMQTDLEGDGFDPATLKTTPTTVFLILPPEFLGSHGVWLRLAVSTILRPLLRSVEVGADTVPVLFMLDEFAQLGYMKIIEDNYALMRGYGIKLWTIWQDLTQAKTLYKDRWESFISNAGVTHTYAPQDLTTRDYLARMSDKRKKWHQTESSSVGLSLKSMPSLNMSSGETRLEDAVMEPFELAALDADEAVMWTRRGFYHLSITPQPDLLTMPLPDKEGRKVLPSVAQRYAEARAAIEQD